MSTLFKQITDSQCGGAPARCNDLHVPMLNRTLTRSQLGHAVDVLRDADTPDLFDA